MIRINLLGAPKPKSKKGGGSAAVVIESGPGGSPTIKILIVLVVVGLANAAYWRQLDREKSSIEQKTKAAEQKNRELADVKARYMERQRQAQAYKRRVDVIDNLRNGQVTPVQLLDMIGETVNGTEAVWLNTMKDEGNNIDIQGMALSTDAVANLIANLKKTGFFKNIEMKETYQDEQVKDMQAFQFTLTCEKGKS